MEKQEKSSAFQMVECMIDLDKKLGELFSKTQKFFEEIQKATSGDCDCEECVDKDHDYEMNLSDYLKSLPSGCKRLTRGGLPLLFKMVDAKGDKKGFQGAYSRMAKYFSMPKCTFRDRLACLENAKYVTVKRTECPDQDNPGQIPYNLLEIEVTKKGEEVAKFILNCLQDE